MVVETASVGASVRPSVHTFNLEYPSLRQQRPILSIIEEGKRLHKVLGQVGSELWFPWQQIAPIEL